MAVGERARRKRNASVQVTIALIAALATIVVAAFVVRSGFNFKATVDSESVCQFVLNVAIALVLAVADARK